MRYTAAGIVLAIVVLESALDLCAAPPKKAEAAQADAGEIVKVNGRSITERDLARLFQVRQVASERREELCQPYLEELIDAQLIRQFLASQKIAAPKGEVDRQVQQVRELAAKRGSDAEKALREMGYTTETLRDDLAFALAKQRYIEQTITAAMLTKYFDEHRAEFDGTQVRARQILLQISSAEEEDWKQAELRLAAIRGEIARRNITFDAAARKHSEAPSRDEGGDVGLLPYRGKMPEAFSQQAFELKVGEMSRPFRTRFGVHLCLVTERVPGDRSLEDVHEEVLTRMAQELWKETVAGLRKKAKIEWKGRR